MPSRRRAAFGLALAAGVISAAAGGWALRAVPAPPPPVTEPIVVRVPQPTPAPIPGPAADPGERIRVSSVTGAVERRTGESQWALLRMGEELRVEDAIRTSKNGHAVLALGDQGRVEIAPRSEFSVREISSTVARFRLDQGRLSAAIPEGSARVRVETRGTDARAESSGGAFVVLSNGRGQLSVASRDGAVQLSLGDATVALRPGEQSEVSGGLPPSAPHKVPGSLFLKVAHPPQGLQREPRAVISGRTAPGAVVSINGLDVASEQDGNFRAVVPLRDGRNVVVVEAEDVGGHTRRMRLPPITVKSRIRDVRAKLTWSAPGGDGP